jgi:protein tyrosine/serine phosphatase
LKSVASAKGFIALSLAFALAASAAFAQTEGSYSELPNFRKVDDHLFRGGQPGNGGIKKLRELGIKTIINLRGEDDLARAEQAEATAAGLSYYSVAMPGLSRPSSAQIERTLALIDSEQNWPVFVHCKRGSDRTGTVIAVYRISHQNWTATQALSEAKRFGLSWMEFGMKDFVSDYYRDWNARQGSSKSVQQSSAATSK